MSETELRAIIRAVDATAPGVSSAKRSLGSLDAVAGRMASSMAASVAGIAGSFFALDRIIGATMAGIRSASELRDLHAQIAAVDGSVQEAARSLAFFDDAQNKTRRTGDDLAKTYGELLPLAMSKGFSRDLFRGVVLQLDQVATRLGKMPDEVNDAFAQIMAGNAKGSNPILRAMGLDPESIATGKVGADELLGRLRTLADEGAAMGDDLDSSWAKIKDGIGDAFAKGWSDAEKETTDAQGRIIARLESQEFLSAFEKAGNALRKGFTSTVDMMTNPGELISRGVGLPFAGTPMQGFMERGARTAIGYGTSAYNAVSGFASAIPNLYGMGGMQLATRGGGRPGSGVDPRAQGFDWGVQFGPSGVDVRDQDKLRKQADEARKLADAIRLRGEALEFEISILRAGDPFQKAEVEFLRDLAAGNREATETLRGLARERADLIRQGKIDSAFGGLVQQGSRTFADVMRRGAGVQAPMATMPYIGMTDAVNRQTLEDAKNNAIRKQNDDDTLEEWERLHRQFTVRLSDSLVDALLNGGEGFGRIAGKRFTELTTKGLDTLMANVFGTPGDPNKFDASGAKQVAGKLYDASGRQLSDRAAKFAAGAGVAMDFAAIGMGSYGAAKQADGSRTGSTISGAMSGAAALPAMPWVGAIVGAVVGFAASYIGEQQRQSEYKYGVPTILKGVANIGAAKNLSEVEKAEIIGDIQETYERTRNAGVRMMMTLGTQFQGGTFGNIDGKFQPNPSANWGKHLQQWLNQTLPDALMGQMKGQLRTSFGSVGMDAKKFDAMWESLDRLDPAKMIAILSGVAKGLTDIQEAAEFFNASSRYGFNTSWKDGMTAMRSEMNAPFYQQIRGQMGDVVDRAGYLDDLVGEDQISLLQEIGQMMLSIRQREREEMQQIILLQDRIKEKSQAAIDRYTVMGMVNEDGSQNFRQQADFFQGKADSALERMNRAQTRQEMERAYDDYMAAIDMIVQLGYQIGPEQGEQWRKWALDQIEKADGETAARLAWLGAKVGQANEEFMAKMQPILDAFNIAVADITTGAGEAGRGLGEFGELLPQRRQEMENLGAGIANLTSNVNELDGATSSAVEALAAFAARLDATLRGSDFIEATMGARAA